MLTILHGDNSFAIADEKRRIVEAYLAESGSDFGLESFDSAVDPQSLWQSITSQPFMVQTKLVVVDEPSKSASLSEFLLSKFDQVLESTHLLIIENKLDKRTQYYKSIKKNPNAKELKLLGESELSKWLTDIAAKMGLKLSAQQARLIIQRAGTDQWRLLNETKKLMPLGAVKDADITDLIDQDPADTVFEMLDALALGDKTKASELYESLRRQRIEPQIILSMLAWQLQNISLVAMAGTRSDQQIAKDAGMNPYVVGKTRATAKRLDRNKLKKAIVIVADCDESIKTGRSEIDETLKLAILKLASIFS